MQLANQQEQSQLREYRDYLMANIKTILSYWGNRCRYTLTFGESDEKISSRIDNDFLKHLSSEALIKDFKVFLRRPIQITNDDAIAIGRNIGIRIAAGSVSTAASNSNDNDSRPHRLYKFVFDGEYLPMEFEIFFSNMSIGSNEYIIFPNFFVDAVKEQGFFLFEPELEGFVELIEHSSN